MSERKLYCMRDGVLKSYELKPNLKSLEDLKKDYVSNPNNQPLFYEITSRDYPTWDTSDFVVPISKINTVGGLFSKPKESILRPLNPVPRYKNHMLDVYCKHDLMSSQLKLVTDDAKSRILYYFLFLSDRYKASYKLQHFDNILSLSKDLFTYELLLKGDYENASAHYFDDVNISTFFGLIQSGEFSVEELQSFLSQEAYASLLEEEQLTHKLVSKISGQ